MTKKSTLSARDQAIKYLNIKMYSRADLDQRLRAKGFAGPEISAVLDEMESLGLVDDQKYAEIFLRNLIEYRTFGYFGIKNKLRQKRLDKDLIEGLLAEHLSEKVEAGIARRLIQKPANVGRPREALIRALQQKGFRTNIILKTVPNA